MKQFKLENGLTVVLLNWPNPSVSVVIGVRCGSQDDDPHQRQRFGRTHFLEHVCFRASRRILSWAELVRKADSFAAEYNAFTDKSTLLFWMESDRRHLTGAIDILSEAILHPRIDQLNVEAERERIRQEIREYDDEPNERVSLDADRILYHQTGYDHPILGNEESLARISVDSLRSHHRRHFVGQRMVVVIAGGFDLVRAERVVRSNFQRLRPGNTSTPRSLDYRTMRGGLHLYREATQQVHPLIAWPTPGFTHPERIAMGLLRNMLTGRASSRLKLQLDSVGHGYSLRDYYWCWQDIGQYHIYFPHSVDHFYDALQIVATNVADLRTSLVNREELDLAVTNLSIAAKSKFGEPWGAASFAAQQVLNGGSFIPLRTYLRSLHQVTRSQVREAARNIFDPRRTLLVVRGPVSGLRRQRIKQILHL